MNEYINELCFGCGKDNPIGLKLNFREEGEEYVTEFTPQEYYQGYPDIMHGGITTTILDEAMGQYLFRKGMVAPTAEINVRFKKAIPISETIKVSAKIVSRKGRMIEMSALVILPSGVVAAEGKGKFIVKQQL
jgi:acyl-coenzyme A thioesterase PaaI-like protein